MDKSALYKVGDNQFVRLPKGFIFEAILDLDIKVVGNSVTINPVTQSWMSLIDVENGGAGFIVNQDMIAQ